MALDQAPHHRGLARRPEGGAGFLRLLDLDQGVDDLAPRDQELVHALVDAVDFVAQVGERGRSGRVGLAHDSFANGGLMQKTLTGAGGALRKAFARPDRALCVRFDRIFCGEPLHIFAGKCSSRDRKDGRGQSECQDGQAKAVADARSGSSAGFAGRAFRRRQAAQARCRHRAVAVPDRLQDLWPAQCRQVQRGPDLPCADRRPACRERPPGHQEEWLVGDADRPGQADRHRALFRHLRECGRRLHGHVRPVLDQSANRQAVGTGISGHHHPRHGARAGHAARPSRHRAALHGRRRLDGRHAGAGMGGELSAARVLACCRSPARRATRRRTSPSTKSAARR